MTLKADAYREAKQMYDCKPQRLMGMCWLDEGTSVLLVSEGVEGLVLHTKADLQRVAGMIEAALARRQEHRSRA